MKYEPVEEKLQTAYLCYSSDEKTRYLSTAGGYISTLIKYLFESKTVATAMTFKRQGIVFEPKLIYTYDAYINMGSIYQDIDILHYLKENIQNIKGKIVLTLLPCQVNAVKMFLQQHNIDSFIISLVCSAQMDLSCTEKYLDLINVDAKNILNFRYRGKGWPKYISIDLKNGTNISEKKVWNQIFHSYFFHKKRCLKCTDTFGVKSDLAVSDPWRIEEMKDDTLGKSIVYIFSDNGKEIHKKMINSQILECSLLKNERAINSQLGTLKKKYYIRNSNIFRKFIKLLNNSTYKEFILSHKFFLWVHTKILNKILVYITHK